MVVNVGEMVRAVRVAIDMNRNDGVLIADGDADTLELDDIIRSKVVDAVRLVETEAPVEMLESGHDFVGPEDRNVFIGSDGKGFIILPDDFMRLVAFRMSDWQRTVYDAISESDPRYGLQSSKWKGICGNSEKPVCALVRRSEGKVLEFYSCRTNKATVAQATYMPFPRIDENEGIDIAEECYSASVYRAAALALASVGDQLSTTMLEMSKSLLQ